MYKISRLSMQYFMSIKDIELELDIGDNMILVTGYDHKKKCSNGSGKTSLMDGILFSKYGAVLKGSKKYAITTPELVHYYNYNNTMKTRIDLVDVSDGNRISIEKSIKNAMKPQSVIKTKVYENDELLQGGFKSSREYDRYLREHILQFDLDSFYRLHVFYGSSYVHFFSLPPSSKVDIIEHFITLMSFSDISREMTKDISVINKDISDLTSVLQKKKDEKTIVRKHSDKYKEMAISSLNSDIDEKRKKLLELKVLLKKNVLEKEELEKRLLDEDYDKLATDITEKKNLLSTQRIRVKAKIKEYVGTLDNKNTLLEDNVLDCPLCMQRLDNKKVIKEHLGAIELEKEKGSQLLEKIEGNISNCEKKIRQIAHLRTKLVQKIEDINNIIRRDEISIDLFEKEIVRINDQIENLDTFHDEETDKKQNVIYKDMIGIVKDTRSKMYDRRKLNFLSSLSSHRSEFKRPLLQDYLYMLSVLVNKYIKELWEDDAVGVEIVMKPADNDIDLLLEDGRRYIGLSAGEKRSVDIATLLAFMEMASMIKRTNLGYILVDEVIEHLSSPLAYRCVKLMSDFIRQAGIQCLFISHNPVVEDPKVIAECFDRHVHIEKSLEGISKLTKNEQI